MKTKISELLKIKYPILQGGMAWVSTFELAAAVSNAGGLGIIAAGNAPAIWLKEQIINVKQHTKNPFGVNVMLLSPYVDEVMQVCFDEKVPVVTTGAGNPVKYIDKLKSNGTIFIPVIPSVALAKKMERSGVDAIIAEGTESGGHIGEITTMALIPQVVDCVSIPVIAAGGIGDSRGIVAAFALGASGVQMGTRFICSTECYVHINYKNFIIDASDRDAVVSGRITGHPVRSLKNKLTKKFDILEKEGASIEEFNKLGSGKLQLAAVDGEKDYGSMMAGQIAGLISDIKSCEVIINDLVDGYYNIIKKLEV